MDAGGVLQIMELGMTIRGETRRWWMACCACAARGVYTGGSQLGGAPSVSRLGAWSCGALGECTCKSIFETHHGDGFQCGK